jgi:hypothetical protein
MSIAEQMGRPIRHVSGHGWRLEAENLVNAFIENGFTTRRVPVVTPEHSAANAPVFGAYVEGLTEDVGLDWFKLVKY